MNEREQQYLQVESQPKNEKYANRSVGARVRLIVSGVIKGYVEVNDDVENETMRYLGKYGPKDKGMK